MSSIIQIKNTSLSGSVPTNLTQGELAINVTNGRLFYGSGSRNVVKEFTGNAGTINTGSLLTTASFNAWTGSSTSRFFGTASFALTSSRAISASFALTSSYVLQTISASNALTASYVNPLRQDVLITGSLLITGSTTQRGNNTLIGTTTLTGSIQIAGNVIPQISSSFDLGSLTNPWRSIYVQSGSISIQSDIPGGIPATISNANGNVTFAGAGFQLKSGSFVPFEVSSTARTIIRVPSIPANDVGGLSVIGSSDGSYQPITVAGGMVHITGNDGQVNRFNLDAFGSGSTTSFNGVISRAARGTASAPSQSKTGDVTLRISSIGWRGDTGFGGTSVPGGTATSLDFIVLEDQMNNARGSAQQFYNAPIGTLNRVLSAQIDTTGIQTSGSIRALTGFTGSLQGTASWANNAQTASYINPLTQDVIITGSLKVSGSLTEIGNTVLSGSLTLSSGSALRINNGFYVDGNRQFNYGQFSSTQTQSGSADTAYSATFNTTDFSNGVSLVSGSRITVSNTGLYNVQFSTQLHTTSNEAVDFSIWFAMTGSNIANSNTDFSIEKINGGGFQVAALNFLTQITSGSYVELKYSKTTANGQLQAKGVQSTPTRPATPSVILTVTQVA
jgi:hypothetical protein